MELFNIKNKLLIIFFLSGFSSLTYQIVWQKSLSQLIGVNHISVILIVSLFMLGLGLGGGIGGHITKYRFNLYKVYFLLELFLGIFGFFSLDLLKISNSIFSQFEQPYFLDYCVNFTVLFLPTFLMGVSLPIITHLMRDKYKVGELVDKVYSINILGAASGVFMTGFILIGTIGMELTVYLAAAINIILGLMVVALNKSNLENIKPETNDLEDKKGYKKIRISYNSLYLVSLCIGFIAIGYEIILFRIFTTYFGATAYVFTILIFAYLFAYLIVMAIGNNYFGKLVDKWSLKSITLVLVSMSIVSSLLILFGQDLIYSVGLRQNYLILWPFRSGVLFVQIISIIFISMILMLPVLFISGFFPAIVASINNDKKHIASEKLTKNSYVTFNAYPAALKAGINTFKYLEVYSPGPSRISNVIASKTNSLSIGLEQKKISLTDRMTKKFVDEGCILNKDQMRELLINIRASTDNLTVTEYFMTNKQFIYDLDFSIYNPPVDMRTFGCITKLKD